MTDPIRTAALEEWHRVFNDQFWWPARMREHAARCRDFADDMLAAGLIDSLERLDLADLICGAVAHWTEEGRDQWLHPASTYAVMKANGKQIGLLSGTLLCWGADEIDNISYFSGQIDREADPTFVHVRSRVGVEFARIHGRWLTKQRKRYALVEMRRLIRNLTHVRCADPDAYRVAGEMCALTLEAGDFSGYWRWWERRDFSVFRRCPTCLDQSGDREECKRCEGQGFAVMDECPSMMPTDWQAGATQSSAAALAAKSKKNEMEGSF